MGGPPPSKFPFPTSRPLRPPSYVPPPPPASPASRSTALSEKDWHLVKQMAEEHPVVVPCFGLHPWYRRGRRIGWIRSGLRRFFAEIPEAAVGEIGLDKGSHGKSIDFGEQIPLDRNLLETDAPDALPKLGDVSLLTVPVGSSDADIEKHIKDSNSQAATTSNESLNHPANIHVVLKYVVSLLEMPDRNC